MSTMPAKASDAASAQPRERLISMPQVLGSATAAACATAAASYFGIAGTIIGAVAASIIATVVSTASTHSFNKAPRLALSCVGVLAIVMLTVTGVEGIAGKPLSSLWGNDTVTSGTTIGRSVAKDRPAKKTVKKQTTEQESTTVTEEPSAPPTPVTPEPTTPTEPDVSTPPETGQPPEQPAPDTTPTEPALTGPAVP